MFSYQKVLFYVILVSGCATLTIRAQNNAVPQNIRVLVCDPQKSANQSRLDWTVSYLLRYQLGKHENMNAPGGIQTTTITANSKSISQAFAQGNLDFIIKTNVSFVGHSEEKFYVLGRIYSKQDEEKHQLKVGPFDKLDAAVNATTAEILLSLKLPPGPSSSCPELSLSTADTFGSGLSALCLGNKALLKGKKSYAKRYFNKAIDSFARTKEADVFPLIYSLEIGTRSKLIELADTDGEKAAMETQLLQSVESDARSKPYLVWELAKLQTTFGKYDSALQNLKKAEALLQEDTYWTARFYPFILPFYHNTPAYSFARWQGNTVVSGNVVILNSDGDWRNHGIVIKENGRNKSAFGNNNPVELILLDSVSGKVSYQKRLRHSSIDLHCWGQSGEYLLFWGKESLEIYNSTERTWVSFTIPNWLEPCVESPSKCDKTSMIISSKLGTVTLFKWEETKYGIKDTSRAICIQLADGKVMWENNAFPSTPEIGVWLIGDSILVLRHPDAPVSAISQKTGKPTSWNVSPEFKRLCEGNRDPHGYPRCVDVFQSNDGSLYLLRQVESAMDNRVECYKLSPGGGIRSTDHIMLDVASAGRFLSSPFYSRSGKPKDNPQVCNIIMIDRSSGEVQNLKWSNKFHKGLENITLWKNRMWNVADNGRQLQLFDISSGEPKLLAGSSTPEGFSWLRPADESQSLMGENKRKSNVLSIGKTTMAIAEVHKQDKTIQKPQLLRSVRLTTGHNIAFKKENIIACRGQILFARQQMTDSLKCFEDALKRDPRCAEALFGLFELRMKEGRTIDAWDIAERFFAEASDNDPRREGMWREIVKENGVIGRFASHGTSPFLYNNPLFLRGRIQPQYNRLIIARTQSVVVADLSKLDRRYELPTLPGYAHKIIGSGKDWVTIGQSRNYCNFKRLNNITDLIRVNLDTRAVKIKKLDGTLRIVAPVFDTMNPSRGRIRHRLSLPQGMEGLPIVCRDLSSNHRFVIIDPDTMDTIADFELKAADVAPSVFREDTLNRDYHVAAVYSDKILLLSSLVSGRKMAKSWKLVCYNYKKRTFEWEKDIERPQPARDPTVMLTSGIRMLPHRDGARIILGNGKVIGSIDFASQNFNPEPPSERYLGAGRARINNRERMVNIRREYSYFDSLAGEAEPWDTFLQPPEKIPLKLTFEMQGNWIMGQSVFVGISGKSSIHHNNKQYALIPLGKRVQDCIYQGGDSISISPEGTQRYAVVYARNRYESFIYLCSTTELLSSKWLKNGESVKYNPIKGFEIPSIDERVKYMPR